MKFLFLGATATPSTGDAAYASILTGAGHTVEQRDDADANKSLTGVDCVIEGEGASSTSLAAWDLSTVPVIGLQHVAWGPPPHQNMSLLTSGVSVTDMGTWTFYDNTLTAALGLTPGVVTMYSSVIGGRVTRSSTIYQAAGSGVQYGAQRTSAPSDQTLWAYEQGALLADGTTPAPRRRLGFSMSQAAALALTPAGQNVVLKASVWAATPPIVAPVFTLARTTRETIAVNTPTKGVAPFTVDFTLVSGPATNLTDNGDNATLTRPDPLATDIVIDVKVTGADGGNSTTRYTIAAPTVSAPNTSERTFRNGSWIVT